MKIVDYCVNLKHAVEFIGTAGLFRVIRNWPEFLACYLGINQKPIVQIRLHNGLTFDIRPEALDCRTVHEICIRDDYRLRSMHDVSGTIIDIGANIGVFAVSVLHAYPHTRVIACEPMIDNIKLLRNNIDLNSYGTRAIVVEQAVSEKHGAIDFYKSQASGGEGTIMPQGTCFEKRTVDAITLADLFERFSIRQCSLVKMDVEGAEYQILYSTPRKILDKIDRIHLEYHTTAGSRDMSGDVLAAYLRGRGFAVTVRRLLSGKSGYLFCTRQSDNAP
jgi:FkbM family methyltransferase